MSTRPGRAPTVSVCIPTFNRLRLLQETLESIRAQSFTDYELLICDDCSTDDTYAYLRSLRWPNLRVFRNDRNRNIHGTLERLFSECAGTYIGMQHDHDFYGVHFLERMVQTLERYPSAGFACAAYHVRTREDAVLLDPYIEEFDLFPPGGLLSGEQFLRLLASKEHTHVAAMGTMFRREVVDRAGGYRPDWYIASDEDLYRRVAQIADVAFCPERLFTMRARPASREAVLGSWKAIYTLHELRADTTRRMLRATPWQKGLNLARLRLLRDRALGVEAAKLWSYGDVAQLRQALDLEAIPPLPTARPLLRPEERAALRLWTGLLQATSGLGARLGARRRRRRTAGVRTAAAGAD